MKASTGEVDKRRSFGFENDGVTLNESEAAIIREHAQRLLAGETQDSLIKELNENASREAFTTVRGNAWTYTTYRQLMTRPRNAGLIKHNGKVVEGVRLPQAILTDDVHFRLVGLYSARKRGRQPSGRYLLSGIAECGRCGERLTGRPVTGTPRRQYWCSVGRHLAIDADQLEEWAADYAVRSSPIPRKPPR